MNNAKEENMLWKQFLTPVASLDPDQARAYITEHDPDSYELLDVRQPKEYQVGHIPGATLAPITELETHIQELDKDKPTLVYCAIGGRSRAASQILAGKGFKHIYNMGGGFKAWSGEAAFGPVDQGMHIFPEDLTLEQCLVTAFGLELGLQEMYRVFADEAISEPPRKLFELLAEIEEKHKSRLLEEYRRSVSPDMDMAGLEKRSQNDALEGGMTTEQYLDMLQPNREDKADIIFLAMSIEAQAMDLYERAARNAKNDDSRQALQHLGKEEKEHLRRLGELLDQEG